jgi:serine/threonine-protein kinase
VTGTARPVPRGYELVRVLGEGGFGEVVLARHVVLGRLVAIKRVHAYALGSADDLARFEREAKILATLDHPAVVRVLDFQIDERGDAALVMEYVPGSALDAMLRDGPLPPAAALRVLGDVADALTVAAERGIVHRDIKSANVFVQPDGSAKLGDFGIARMLGDPAVFRTTDGSVRGTPGYMAPEAGLGEGTVDARSDAYAFAVLAFETLTGQLPVPGLDMAQALVAHWSAAPPSAADVVPGFPPAAAEALADGLAKDPDRRPLPRELVDRLLAVPAAHWPATLGGGGGGRAPAPPTTVGAVDPPPTGTPAPPTVQQAPRSVPQLPVAPRRRRRRWPIAVAAAVAVVALGLAAWRWWPESTPDALAVEGIVLTLDPANGQGGCPTADYRVAAEVSTNGGPGTLAFSWELPDGRSTSPDSVAVAAGQQRAQLSLDFQLAGPPVEGPPVLVVSAPQQSRTEGPVVHFEC